MSEKQTEAIRRAKEERKAERERIALIMESFVTKCRATGDRTDYVRTIEDWAGFIRDDDFPDTERKSG